MITIVDYGLGNIKSVCHAMKRIGAKVVVSSDKTDITSAQGIILPGVGAFKKAVENLARLNIFKCLKEVLGSGIPYLGICLGMQLLFSESHEHGITSGFGLINGTVERFPNLVKVPHMGWNQVAAVNEVKMFAGIKNESFFYFDHSFYAIPGSNEVVSGETDYGIKFTCAVEVGNLWGVQFHPEKSSETGLVLLKNFKDVC